MKRHHAVCTDHVNRGAGFTTVELIVTSAIGLFIVGMVTVSYGTLRGEAKNVQLNVGGRGTYIESLADRVDKTLAFADAGGFDYNPGSGAGGASGATGSAPGGPVGSPSAPAAPAASIALPSFASSPLGSPAYPQVGAFQPTAFPTNGSQLEAAARTPNTHIQLAEGTYNIGGLDMAKGVQVVGAGMGKTFLNTSGRWSSVKPTGQNRVADFSIIGPTESAIQIDAESTPDIIIQRISTSKGTRSIFGSAERMIIEGCRFGIDTDNGKGYGLHHLYLINCGNTIVRNSIFGPAYVHSVKLPAYHGSVHDILVEGNQFLGPNGNPPVAMHVNGSWPEAHDETHVFNVAVVGNAFSGAVGSDAGQPFVEARNVAGVAVVGNRYRAERAIVGYQTASSITESGNLAVGN